MTTIDTNTERSTICELIEKAGVQDVKTLAQSVQKLEILLENLEKYKPVRTVPDQNSHLAKNQSSSARLTSLYFSGNY